MTESNPASRLHTLLQEVRKGDPKKRMLDVWVETFALPSPSDLEVTRRLILLNEMLDDTERTLKLNPKLNHTIYLSCFPQVRTVLSPLHLQSTRDGVAIPHLTPEVLARLEFCAEAMREEWSEAEISPDDIRLLATDLNELIERVAGSDIAPSLRKALLESLEAARVTISLYRVYGAKGLRRNLQGLFGLIFTERDGLAQEAARNSDVLEQLGKWIDRVDSLSSKAIKVHRALKKPFRFLLSLAAKDASANDDSDSTETTIEA